MRHSHQLSCAPARRPARGGGFSLIELIVVVAMMGIFALVFYGVFTFNVEAGRVQSQIADMQQNLRVAQHDIQRFTRMAGRGGLPVTFAGGSLPNGVSISVENNVPAGTRIGDGASPEVLEGTDILTVRGVFSNPVYQVKVLSDELDNRVFTINPLTPTGEPQNLGPLAEAVYQAKVGPGPREPLVLVSPLGQYMIFQLEDGRITDTGGINPEVTGVEIVLSENADYEALLVQGGGNPTDMTTVASVGIIEEYRYFIRKVSPAADRVIPRLSRARFYAGTDQPHPSNPFMNEDIADHIFDLQVAFGVDREAPDGTPGPDGLVWEAPRDAGAEDDEWLFNHGDDDPAAAGVGNLELVRLSLLARTSRADRRWGERRLAWLEDHDYVGGPVHPTANDLLRRRRLSQTVVNLRNMRNM